MSNQSFLKNNILRLAIGTAATSLLPADELFSQHRLAPSSASIRDDFRGRVQDRDQQLGLGYKLSFTDIVGTGLDDKPVKLSSFLGEGLVHFQLGAPDCRICVKKLYTMPGVEKKLRNTSFISPKTGESLGKGYKIVSVMHTGPDGALEDQWREVIERAKTPKNISFVRVTPEQMKEIRADFDLKITDVSTKVVVGPDSELMYSDNLWEFERKIGSSQDEALASFYRKNGYIRN